MKPPRLADYRDCPLLLVITVLFFVGCKPAADESSPPTKQAEPARAAAKPAEGTSEPSVEPTVEPTGPSIEPVTQPDEPAESSTKPDDVAKPKDRTSDRATETRPAEPTDLSETLYEPGTGPTTPGKLGPPLGEDVAKLTPLQPAPVIWIDRDKHRVVMLGQVCQTSAILEMFACPSGTKEHESVVVIPARARDVHAGLLAVGAKPGSPVQFHPQYKPASGTEIEIDVRWKDEKGTVRSAKAQEWIRNMNTKKPMRYNWVFAGSSFWTDERTGRKYYQAEGGDLICVSNFPSALLDLPIESSQSDSNRLFEAFTEKIPPLGTPVTVILKPKLQKKPEKKEEKP